ncbi:hypothetical protein ACFY36_05325 [Actinoplanes sp. NPDC000266]
MDPLVSRLEEAVRRAEYLVARLEALAPPPRSAAAHKVPIIAGFAAALLAIVIVFALFLGRQQ